MTDPRTRPDDAPNVGHDPLEDEIAALQGEAPLADQDSVVDPDEIDDPREPTISEEEWGVPITPGLQPGETDDPLVAIEDGLTYVPPNDPVFVPADDPEGIEIAGAPDETEQAESDVNQRIRDALKSDGATTELADRVEIAVIGSTAILRGRIEGMEDSDALVDVVSRVDGISDVRDETEVVGL